MKISKILQAATKIDLSQLSNWKIRAISSNGHYNVYSKHHDCYMSIASFDEEPSIVGNSEISSLNGLEVKFSKAKGSFIMNLEYFRIDFDNIKFTNIPDLEMNDGFLYYKHDYAALLTNYDTEFVFGNPCKVPSSIINEVGKIGFNTRASIVGI